MGLTVLLLLLWQIILGLLQLSGIAMPEHEKGICKGSFDNPMLYGGFLSVSACICWGFYRKTSERRLLRFIFLIPSLIGLAMLPLTRSRAAITAFIAAIICYISYKNKWSAFFHKHLIILSVLMAILLSGLYFRNKPSVDKRVFIDRICLRAVSHGSLMGSGPGRFGKAYATAQADFFGKKDRPERLRMIADCPKQALCEYLQIGIEGGPIVMILYINLMLVITMAFIGRQTPWKYGFILLIFFSMLSRLYQNWMFIIIAIFITVSAGKTEQGNSRKELSYYISFLLVSSILTILTRSEYKLRKRIDEKFDYVVKSETERQKEFIASELGHVSDKIDHNSDLLLIYGCALYEQGKHYESNLFLRYGTEISSDPIFWAMIGRNYQSIGDYMNAEQCYLFAFQCVPNKIYPLYLLTSLYYETNDSVLFTHEAQKTLEFQPETEIAQAKKLKKEIRIMLSEYKRR